MCLPTWYWSDTPRCGSVTRRRPARPVAEPQALSLLLLGVCEVSRPSGADVCWCASRCLREITLSRPLGWPDAATLPFTACEVITLLIGPDLPINGKSAGLPQPLKAADPELLARFRKRLHRGELLTFFFFMRSYLHWRLLNVTIFFVCACAFSE